MANDSLQNWFEDITIEKKSKEQIEIKIPEKKITLPLTGYEVSGILTLKLEDGRSVEVLSVSNPVSLKIKEVIESLTYEVDGVERIEKVEIDMFEVYGKAYRVLQAQFALDGEGNVLSSVVYGDMD